jgi:protein kinase C substrate 80K-H
LLTGLYEITSLILLTKTIQHENISFSADCSSDMHVTVHYYTVFFYLAVFLLKCFFVEVLGKMLKFLILSIAVLNSVHCDKKPLGVPLERASFYDLAKPFACLDGSSVIPFEMINDDYCDCRDGSDEPGTNACMNGVFTCDNHGHVASPIPSSRVNDGICDCCDGSDEYHAKKSCENTCNVEAERMRESQEKARLLLENGLQKKKDLLQKGAELRVLMRTRIQELDAKRATAENDKKLLEESKNAAEARAKEATDIEDAVHEEERKRLELIEKERKSNELFDLLDTDKNGV